MRTLTLLCVSCLIMMPDWALGQSFGVLDANRIAARFYAEGDMFWDLIGQPTFEVPQGSGKHTLYAGAPWIGAIDESGQLRVAAQTYRQSGMDYAAGPIATTYPASYDQRYQRVWAVTTQEIQDHQLNYAQVGYITPANIRDWPGNGDVTNGEPAQLAPYMDLNNNGVYEPLSGEYPVIKGDQALFTIFNDFRLFHTETGGEPLGVEFHLMVYAYNRPSDAPDNWLNDVLFMDYKIFNRTKQSLINTQLGMWLDWDLGNYVDDYIGCDSTRDMWFAYNADDLDEGPNGYGASPPAMGATWLNQPLQHHMYWSNDFTVMGNPASPSHYYNFLTSRWKDGSPLTEGGNGYGGTTPTNFAYPGDPSSSVATEWHEANAGNPAGDRRGMGSIGPFDLAPAESFCAQLALVYGRDADGNQLTSLEILKQKVDSVRAYHANSTGEGCLLSGAQPVNTTQVVVSNEQRWQVAPNPARTHISLIAPDGIQEAVEVELYDVRGRKLRQERISQGALSVWSVAELPSGAYWFRIKSKTGVQTLSWIKQDG